jgi:hypothetical protein
MMTLRQIRWIFADCATAQPLFLILYDYVDINPRGQFQQPVVSSRSVAWLILL